MRTGFHVMTSSETVLICGYSPLVESCRHNQLTEVAFLKSGVKDAKNICIRI